MRAGFALAILIGATMPACAGDGFNIVIPGRPDVPIIINGIDASYAVVEGDWGLGKSIHVQPTIYGGVPIDPDPHVGHYYPTLGKKPGYGRLEIEPSPNRPLPKPAPAYHQSWISQSAPPQPQSQMPFYPPPVMISPQGNGQGRRDRRSQGQGEGGQGEQNGRSPSFAQGSGQGSGMSRPPATGGGRSNGRR
jgi:hypothetical protein